MNIVNIIMNIAFYSQLHNIFCDQEQYQRHSKNYNNASKYLSTKVQTLRTLIIYSYMIYSTYTQLQQKFLSNPQPQSLLITKLSIPIVRSTTCKLSQQHSHSFTTRIYPGNNNTKNQKMQFDEIKWGQYQELRNIYNDNPLRGVNVVGYFYEQNIEVTKHITHIQYLTRFKKRKQICDNMIQILENCFIVFLESTLQCSQLIITHQRIFSWCEN
eukprot:TRINITY_DN42373_c2_g1_i2.p1 TRINITY_DN42373_c2_g1~~TRINITY_DN42373_c2_g1_i2.p1  ORF type:complete len:214 (+),score=-23.20 TRINITY_DN42373_c2_g1_i2:2-643(+)